MSQSVPRISALIYLLDANQHDTQLVVVVVQLKKNLFIILDVPCSNNFGCAVEIKYIHHYNNAARNFSKIQSKLN